MYKIAQTQTFIPVILFFGYKVFKKGIMEMSV